MTFVKGQSGNPNGRPPNNRALTALLEKAGNKSVAVAGKRVARKRVVAESIWQLVTEGETILPNGEALRLDPVDWIGLVKWIYQHIDGAPAQKHEHAGEDGGPLEVVVKVVKNVTYDDI